MSAQQAGRGFMHTGPNEAGYPKVQGECPACHARSLFLAADGYVTCAMLSCPDPCSPSEALGVNFPAKRSVD